MKVGENCAVALVFLLANSPEHPSNWVWSVPDCWYLHTVATIHQHLQTCLPLLLHSIAKLVQRDSFPSGPRSLVLVAVLPVGMDGQGSLSEGKTQALPCQRVVVGYLSEAADACSVVVAERTG